MSNIFISYSRTDAAFVKDLEAALSAREKEVWLDIDDIAPGAKWREEIHLGLAGCDGIVFVMTPHSLRSAECGKELAQALELGKRIVPVLREEPNGTPVPEELATINWVKLREGDDFDLGIGNLLEALDKDFAWVHEHTRLGLRAAEWATHDRSRAYVLRGDDLREAERFLTDAAGKEPEPTAEQLEYVAASRAAAKSFTQRLLAAVSLALVIAVALTVIAFIERDTARTAQKRAYSRQLAADAETQLGVDPELSVMLASKGYDVSPTAESVDVLRQALVGSAIRMAVRPSDGVSQADLTPDGNTLVTVGRRDGTVRLWRYPTARQLAVLTGVDAAHGQLSVNPVNGRIVVVSGGSARVFSGSRAALPPLGSQVDAAAWGGNGRLIVTGSRDGTVAIWNASTGAEISHADAGLGPIVAVALGDQPRVLAALAASGIARVYDFVTRQHADLATGCTAGRGRLRLSPDGSRVVPAPGVPDESRLVTFGPTCPAAILWNTQTGKQVGNLAAWAVGVNDAAFSPDASTVVLAAEVAVAVNSRDGTQVGQYVAHNTKVNAVAMAPWGTMLDLDHDTATGGDDGSIRLWSSSIPASTSSTVLRANETSIGSLVFAAGGHELVSVDGDGSAARVWSPGPRWATVGAGIATIGALTADGSRALGDSQDGSIGVFATGTGHELRELRGSQGFDTGSSTTTSLGGFSAGGRVAWVSGQHGLRSWRTSTGNELPRVALDGEMVQAIVPAVSAPVLVLELHAPRGGAWHVAEVNQLTGSVSRVTAGKPDAVAVDRSGRFVVVASGRTARVVDLRRVRTWNLVGAAGPVTLVSISADGRRVALAGTGFATVFDLPTGTPVGHPAIGRSSPVTAITLSYDGSLLGVGYKDLQAQLLPATGGRQIVAVKEDSQPDASQGVTSLLVSRDRNFLITSEANNDAEIWDIASGALLYHLNGNFLGASDDAHTVLTAPEAAEAWTCDVCVPAPALRALARTRVTRGFTHDEQAKFLTG